MACRKNRSAAEIDCLEGSPKGRPEAYQKRTDDRPEGGGTLNSGGPDGGPGHGATRAVDGPAQPKEAGSVSVREDKTRP